MFKDWSIKGYIMFVFLSFVAMAFSGITLILQKEFTFSFIINSMWNSYIVIAIAYVAVVLYSEVGVNITFFFMLIMVIDNVQKLNALELSVISAEGICLLATISAYLFGLLGNLLIRKHIKIRNLNEQIAAA